MDMDVNPNVPPHSTPQDRTNRDRIEQVAQKLLALCGALEQRLMVVEARMTDLEREQEQARG